MHFVFAGERGILQGKRDSMLIIFQKTTSQQGICVFWFVGGVKNLLAL